MATRCAAASPPPWPQPHIASCAATVSWRRRVGAQIENSMYEIKMNVEESCKILCTMPYKKEDLNQFKAKVAPLVVRRQCYFPAHRQDPLSQPKAHHARASSPFASHSPRATAHHQIAEDYRVNWIVDNLPAATRVVEPASGGNPARIITIYERGFPLGFKGVAPATRIDHARDPSRRHAAGPQLERRHAASQSVAPSRPQVALRLVAPSRARRTCTTTTGWCSSITSTPPSTALASSGETAVCRQ